MRVPKAGECCLCVNHYCSTFESTEVSIRCGFTALKELADKLNGIKVHTNLKSM